MPPVIIAAVAGAAMSVGTAWAAGTLATLTIATVATSAAISAAMAGASMLLAPKVKPFRQELTDRTHSVRQAITPRQIVYGKVKTGGPIIYLASTGTGAGANKWLQLVIPLACHEVEAIDTVYFDADPLVLGADGAVTGGKYFDANWPVPEQRPRARVWKHLGGAGQVADARLIGVTGGAWTSAHVGHGIAYLYIELEFTASIYTNGIPNITAVVRGKRVYDPRDGVTRYSDNAALCLRDFMTLPARLGGVGAAEDEIDGPNWIAQANLCDELVPAGAGTETRYTINGTVALSSANTPRNSLEGLLNACGGKLLFAGGKWRLLAAAYRNPVADPLTIDDLRGDLSFTPRPSTKDVFNAVKGTYSSPENLWQPADYPPIVSDAFTADDGGERKWNEIDRPYTTSGATAQRLGKIDLLRTRQPITVTAPCKLTMMRVQAGDVIQVTLARQGWTAKPFEVVEWGFTVTDEGALGVDLSLRETDPSIYDWATSEEQTVDPAPNTTLPDWRAVPDVRFLSVDSSNSQVISGADGTLISRALVTWSAALSGVIDRYEIHWRVTGTGDLWPWQASIDGNTGGATFAYSIDNLPVGVSIDVRVRAVNALGVPGNFVTITGHTIAGYSARPNPAITGLKVVGSPAGNPGLFNTADATFEWTGGATLGALFDTFVVNIRDATTGALRRSAPTKNPTFTYLFADNAVDGLTRTFVIGVQVRTRLGGLSAEVQLTAINPVPGAPTNVDLQGEFRVVSLRFTPPADPDYAGVLVWMAEETGFARDASTEVYRGPDTFIPIRAEPGKRYYLRLACFDVFGTAGATESAELTTLTVGIVHADLIGQVVGNGNLLNELSTRIALIDTPTTGLIDRVTGAGTGLLDRVTGTEGLITGLRTDLTTAQTGITTEQTTRQTADTALSTRIDTVVAQGAAGFNASLRWDYATGVESWTGSNGATVAHQSDTGAVRLTGTTTNPRWNSPVISLNGTRNPLVKVRLTRKAGLGWNGNLYYTTAGHALSSSYRKTLANPNLAVGSSAVLTWDMAALTNGGTDWITNTITGLRFDFGGAVGDSFDVDWIALGAEAPAASTAALETEITARATADTAEITARETLAARVTTAEGGITTNAAAVQTEAAARAAADTAEATARADLAARVTLTEGGVSSAAAAVTAEQTARATADTALGQRVDTVVARFDGDVSNLVGNPVFAADLSGWNMPNGGRFPKAEPGVPLGAPTPFVGYVPMRDNTYGPYRPVTGGQRHFVSLTAASHAAAQPLVICLSTHDAAGNWQGVTVGPTVAPGETWRKVSAYITLPDTAVDAMLWLINDGPGGPMLYPWFITLVEWRPAGLVDGAFSAIQTEATARAAADLAEAGLRAELAARVTSAEGSVSATNAAVSAEQTARATADTALGQRIDTVSARVDAGFSAALTWNFAAGAEGWLNVNCNFEFQSDGSLRLVPANNDPWLQINGLSLDGRANPIVRARVTRRGGSGWDGNLFFTSTGHGQGPYAAGSPNPNLAVGQTATVEWYMPAVPGSDWTTATVTGLRLDFGNSAADVFDVDWIAVGSAAPGASIGAVQAEAAARASADTAEATARQTVQATLSGRIDPLEAARATTYRIGARGNSTWYTQPIDAGLYNATGGQLLAGSRSYTLLVFARSDPTVWQSFAYDTYADPANAAALAAKLNSLNADKIIVLFSYDEPSTNRMSGGLPDAITRCGGTRAIWDAIKFHGAYILIGYPGCGAGNGRELYQGAVDYDNNAWLDTTLQILNGNILGLGGSAAVQAEATARAAADGTIEAKYSIKVDVNGHVAGYGLIATANNGTPTSDFIVSADRFSVAKPGAGGINPTIPFIVSTVGSTPVLSFNGYASFSKILSGTVDTETLYIGGTNVVLDGPSKKISINWGINEIVSLGQISPNVYGIRIKDDTGAVILSSAGGLAAGSVKAAALAAGTGVNMAYNADMRVTGDGWSAGGNSSGWAGSFGWNLSADWSLIGGGTMWRNIGGAVPAGYFFDITNANGGARYPVIAGRRYEVSAYFGAHRCNAQVICDFYDAAGAFVGAFGGNVITNNPSGGAYLGGYGRSVGFGIAPAGAVSAVIIMRGLTHGGNDPHVFGTRAYFGEAGTDQTEASPWAPGPSPVGVGGVAGLGTLATRNDVDWNTHLVSKPAFGNFAYLSSINSANISTYIAGAAIGSAYISDLNASKLTAGSIDTLDINIRWGSVNVWDSNTSTVRAKMGHVPGYAYGFFCYDTAGNVTFEASGVRNYMNGAIIGDLTVDTLKLTTGAVTSGGGASGIWSASVTLSTKSGDLSIIGRFGTTGRAHQVAARIVHNGNEIASFSFLEYGQSGTFSYPLNAFITGARDNTAGTATITIEVTGFATTYGAVPFANLTVLEFRR